MPKIAYVNRAFSAETLAVIEKANQIIEEYTAQGFDLTLRQLYYQFVSRDLIPNTEKSYKRLGSIIDDARLAGLVDWDAILDRTRNMHTNSHWDSPQEIVEACSNQYRIDLWANQPVRVECWIEKDALVGVIAKVCEDLDVPYFACRGYSSQSAMWRSAMRACSNAEKRGQGTVILYLGDHDPSGIDMTRDVRDRMKLLSNGSDISVQRLALNMDQVRQYKPPPNPAKMTDARASGYVEKYGDESWELDALEPKVIVALVKQNVMKHVDKGRWKEDSETQDKGRERLLDAAAWLGDAS